MKKKKDTTVSLSKEELQKQLKKKNLALARLEKKLLNNERRQAREPQIQLALESVRARTMAMQKSAELAETSFMLFQQFKDLGETSEQISIGIFNEDDHVMELYSTLNGSQWKEAVKVDLDEPVTMKKIHAAWKEQKKSLVIDLSGKDLREYNTYRKKISNLEYREDRWVIHIAFFSKGALTFSTTDPHPGETMQLLERFAGVFDGTYTRFLDLKKAEEQARESQIQLALERVRARTMAMQKSDELKEAAALLFQQVKSLGAPAYSCGYNIWEKNEKTFTSWMSSEDGIIINAVLNIPLTEDANFIRYVESKQKGEQFFVLELRGERIQEHYQYLKTIPAFKGYFDYAVSVGFDLPETQIHHLANFSHGNLLFITLEPCPEFHNVFKRFAAVFEQTYTRFLDLQKAEAQTREAQIEVALERVRFHTMAMNNSEDVGVATIAMFSELEKLELKNIRVGIAIFRPNPIAEVWSFMKTGEGKAVRTSGTLDMNATLVWQRFYKGWQQKEDFFHYFLAGEEKKAYYKVLSNSPNYSLSGEMPELPDQHFQAYYFPEGAIWAYSLNLHSEEHKQILKKFTAVFSLTFRRYQDLKKAEAQTKESQIQLALERVRARTMAMHSSEDVTSAAETMFEELKKLGINCLRGGITNIRPDKTMDVFGITNTDGKTMKGFSFFDMNLHPIWQRLFESWTNKEEVFIGYLAGREKEDYLNIVNSRQNYLPQSIVEFPDTHFQAYGFDQGGIWTYSLQPHNEADKEIMKRFASGFALTFRRYQDLKKAEAQAREAQIEAALERVRSKAMSMQKTEDLSNAVAIVFDELEKMDLGAIRCGISIINREDHTTKIWSTTKTAEGTAVQVSGYESMEIHPLLKGAFNAWSQLKDFSYVLKDDDLTDFYTALSNTNFKLPGDQAGLPNREQHMYVSHFPVGGLYVFKGNDFSDDTKKIIKRFGEVFNLTYTRYNDLQIAEASAKEAIRQAALDRIRADIASMRTTMDLERITPLIWNELNILDVPFIRCGVFIMDDEQQHIKTFLSTPDGKAIATFHIPYDTPGNIKLVISHWEKHENYIDHWDEEAFTTFAVTLVKQGALTSPEQYLQTIPHGGFYLHFLPFLQGMLYVGNTTRLSEEETDLIQSIAHAFSTAYSRYEDFNKLESAKQQIEKTLVDLKQAQSQLIQSEKMASLGELTAGIAHEIQNPLNFVNNFSEVSYELISEAQEERSKEQGTRDEQMLDDILNDIKQNLEKINHHGKRADAIVKGMLQHSRSSIGQKAPTDVNALADEYLRLSYHGLRAKDNSFNVTIKTDFDTSAEKINIIPQDIGRVLLNLYNNAFYAVNEKCKRQVQGYEPTISVSTKKSGNQIFITVGDNGNGVPQKVVDKIFQPFFTTKPTGQGTGLGLSLSYDIVKAHGGAIKVETKEGEGSQFIIQLPLI